MDTQNTPVHLKLWHREFWMLTLANLLLTMSVYMQIPLIPIVMGQDGYSHVEIGVVMGAYGIGLFLLGGFCSYWVNRYRRSRVCHFSIVAMVACVAVLYRLYTLPDNNIDFWILVVLRLVFGAVFGLAQMVLSSTLIVDVCESFQRTEANHVTGWFARFGMALGPLLVLVLGQYTNVLTIVMVAAGLPALAYLLIKSVNFPFRTPSEVVRFYSLDRFFLPEGWLLFLNLFLITAVLGMMLTLAESSVIYYAMLGAGFVLALLAERLIFQDADLESEAVTGLILMAAALLMDMFSTLPTVRYMVPLLIGAGAGIIGSRFLLFFIKLSHHCQRGTSQSTFFLGWESGLSAGLFLGHLFYAYSDNRQLLLLLCLGLVLLCLLMYNLFTHKWYMAHKNR